jgi:hypothetical protein
MMNEAQFRRKLKGYLAQVFILHRKGNQQAYNTMQRLNAISRLAPLAGIASTAPIAQLAAMAARREDDLYTVLPVTQNRSYQATAETLKSIINFCKRTVKSNLCNTSSPLV